MNSAHQLIPALTLQTQLAGLQTLGLDVAALRTRMGWHEWAPEDLVPVQAYLDMWAWATQAWGRPGLPTALASAIPFGSFGVVDFLVASADTVQGCMASLQQHLSLLASDSRLDLHTTSNGLHWVEPRALGANAEVVEEFMVALLVQRLAYLTDQSVRPAWVALRTAAPLTGPDEREQRLKCPVRYGHATSALVLSTNAWDAPVTRADPALHATLRHVARQLQIDAPQANDLVLALRARLRDLLPSGEVSPARMARLIGMSERTLQRRLTQLGCSFAAVVEEFSREEALRLLSDARLPIVEVAARLGYAEQTSFTRAFKRWHGNTPAAWRRDRAATST